MEYTPNLNLKKPGLKDNILISDINENMEALDGAVSELQKGNTSIPDLETTDKTLAGAINEVKNEMTGHVIDPMPHKYTNSDNGKTYRHGFGIDAGGPYIIQQEVD